MANLCVLSYKNHITSPPPNPFTRCDFVSVSNSQAWVFEGEKSIAVAFRGTDEFWDILCDANITTVDTPSSGTVHKGFLEAFLNLLPEIKERLEDSNKKMFLTGHSLGGAMASICAAYFKHKNPVLVTFGSPKVGLANFAEAMKNITHIRWTNDGDKVCKVPIFRFVHFGEERRLKTKLKFLSRMTRRTHGVRQYAQKISNLHLPFFELETLLEQCKHKS